MRIYNSDGSEPEMFGNGIHCLAQFLNDLATALTSRKILSLSEDIIVETRNGKSVLSVWGISMLLFCK